MNSQEYVQRAATSLGEPVTDIYHTPQGTVIISVNGNITRAGVKNAIMDLVGDGYAVTDWEIERRGTYLNLIITIKQ